MKLFLAALIASVATAQLEYYPETDNECLKEEGAEFVEDCADLYYNECKTYKMKPKGTCQYRAYSDSEMVHYSSNIVIQYWTYASVPKGLTYDDYISGKSANPFKDNKDDTRKAEKLEDDFNMENGDDWPVETLIAKLIEDRHDDMQSN